MQTIVLYTKVIKRVSGIQTFERAFIENMYLDCKIKYVYDATESLEIVEEMRKYAEVIKNTNQIIRGDVCIYSSISRASHNIQAKKFIQVVHTEYSKWNIKPDTNGIDSFIAVSDTVARDLKTHFNIDAKVIPNLLTSPKHDKVLRLLTASRIEKGKGFDRMLKLAQELKREKYKFVWEVYGRGAKVFEVTIKDQFKDIPEVAFLGSREDVRSYMYGVDYVVQLSDNEGFCYSIHEALQMSTPVIVSRWEGVDRIVNDGYNGYILNMDLSNLDIKSLYNKPPQFVTNPVNNSVQLWKELFYFLSK